MPYDARERAKRRIATWMRAQKPKRLTQIELSERLALAGHPRSQSWVSKLLQNGPNLEDLDAIASVMGIDPTALVRPVKGKRLEASTEQLAAYDPALRSVLEMWPRIPQENLHVLVDLVRSWVREGEPVEKQTGTNDRRP